MIRTILNWPNDLLDDYIFKGLIFERSIEQFEEKYDSLDDTDKSNISSYFDNIVKVDFPLIPLE